MSPPPAEPKRNQAEARRVARHHYSYPGCCLCGQTVGEQIAHLDQNPANNHPDNLARLCHHHHWMFDIGLFSLDAIKLQRAHWEATKGKPTNAFMKDPGRNARPTRAKNGTDRELAPMALALRPLPNGALRRE